MKSVRVQSRCTFKRSVRRGGTRGKMKRRRKGGAERELPIAPRRERKSSGWEEEQKQIYDYPTVLSTRETLRCSLLLFQLVSTSKKSQPRKRVFLSLSLSLLFLSPRRGINVDKRNSPRYSRSVVSSYETNFLSLSAIFVRRYA